MQKTRPGLPVATAALLTLAALPGWAASIGSPLGAAVLGQALNLAVPLRIDSGDDLEPRCITAEVTIGDRKLPANVVSAVLEPTSPDTARVRVQTLTNVDEPVVAVVLNVGCQARLTRRFVVLADPPGLEAGGSFAISAMSAAQMVPVAPVLPAAPTQEAAPRSDAQASAAAAAASARAGRPGRTASQPGASKAAARSNAGRPAQTSAGPSARVAALRQAQAGAGAGAAPQAAVQRTASSASASAAPRLKLDSTRLPEDTPAQEAAAMAAVEQAIRAVAEAASAVQAANGAASAAEQRALGLERSLAQLRAENQTQREATTLLRERLASSEAASNWVWPLTLGLLALGALAGWLAWQLAALRRQQRLGWQQAAHPTESATSAEGTAANRPNTSNASNAPLPFVTAAALPARASATPAWPPPAPAAAPLPPAPNTVADGSFAVSTQPSLVDLEPVPETQRTLPLPVAAPPPPEAAAPRDLSIEELIDLEQQAEFFIVLGQDDAAIDLLVEHVRTTGGGSPLPYLKLLEIYHRRGDREAYERTRSRFNQRFNAYAAEWSAGLLQGRSLEDYPGVLPRLAKAWPQPLDAMAELESLLFRKTHGELFDLPAYREVLFLYALARDLLDREAADTGNVDLLLPLADGGDFGVTSPHPYFGLDHDSVFDREAADDRPTSPVDLDLSQGDSPQRIFDPLAARRPQP